ncbi:hypothetical protein YC2023_014880 [Brassica napus]
MTPLVLPSENSFLCNLLLKASLSGEISFYHWTKYLPPVFHRYTDVTKKLTRLDPVTSSATKGTYP